MKELEFVICDEHIGERLDKALPLIHSDFSRNSVQQLITDGLVLVNGAPCSKKTSLKSGDVISVNVPDPVTLSVEAEDIPLDIVYEDEHLLVVNKPKGMVVHPAAGNYNGTLVNALIHHCGDSLSGINGVIRPGIVHRIDKDTSGLLVVAKTDVAHKGLAEQIKEHSFTRVYNTVVVGNVKDDFGTIDAPIARNKRDRKKMGIDPDGRRAVTHYTVLERFGKYTLVRFELETGRTHQIRVHSSHIHHPIVGDEVYGGSTALYKNGQLLHARQLVLTHPTSGEKMTFEAELPDYFENVLEKLRKLQK